MARLRSVNPVEARFFRPKSSGVGRDLPTIALRVEVVISRGEPGESGEFEDVDWAGLLDVGISRAPVVALAVPFINDSTAPVAGEPDSNTGVSLSTLEAERRNNIDMVRLKLEVEPRVERRESVGVCCCSSEALGVSVSLVFVLVRVTMRLGVRE